MPLQQQILEGQGHDTLAYLNRPSHHKGRSMGLGLCLAVRNNRETRSINPSRLLGRRITALSSGQDLDEMSARLRWEL